MISKRKMHREYKRLRTENDRLRLEVKLLDDVLTLRQRVQEEGYHGLRRK